MSGRDGEKLRRQRWDNLNGKTRSTITTLPKGSHHKRARRLAPAPKRPASDARPKAGSFGLKPKIVLYHGAAATQECRPCGINGLRPSLGKPRGSPPFISSDPRKLSGLLTLRLAAPCQNSNSSFRFWEQKICAKPFFFVSKNWKPRKRKTPWSCKPNNNLKTHHTVNINSVVITGNLVNAPELRYTGSGTAVVSGTIANNEFYLDESRAKQQVTTFVDFNVWAKRGEALAQMAKKGQHVYLEGQLRQEIWEDKKDGSTRSKHVIRVRDWQFTQFRTPEAAPCGSSEFVGVRHQSKQIA
jgi:single-strand DNA-binding protein